MSPESSRCSGRVSSLEFVVVDDDDDDVVVVVGGGGGGGGDVLFVLFCFLRCQALLKPSASQVLRATSVYLHFFSFFLSSAAAPRSSSSMLLYVHRDHKDH